MQQLGRTLVVCVAACCGSAIAVAQEPPATVAIPQPSMARSTDMAEFCTAGRMSQLPYPERALQRRINGHVVLDCAVAADGTMQSCQIVEETPARYGFGQAALARACRYQTTPASLDLSLSTSAARLPSGSQVYCPDPTNVMVRRARAPVAFRLQGGR